MYVCKHVLIYIYIYIIYIYIYIRIYIAIWHMCVIVMHCMLCIFVLCVWLYQYIYVSPHKCLCNVHNKCLYFCFQVDTSRFWHCCAYLGSILSSIQHCNKKLCYGIGVLTHSNYVLTRCLLLQIFSFICVYS